MISPPLENVGGSARAQSDGKSKKRATREKRESSSRQTLGRRRYNCEDGLHRHFLRRFRDGHGTQNHLALCRSFTTHVGPGPSLCSST